MKYLFSAISVSLLAVCGAFADEASPRPHDEASQTTQPAKGPEDCSKQVWPHFSPACLKQNEAVSVRVVTAERR